MKGGKRARRREFDRKMRHCETAGCGHPAQAHQHYRHGTECAGCGCKTFTFSTPHRTWRYRIWRWLVP